MANRYFAPVTQDFLKSVMIDDMYNLVDKLGKDLKVKFDLENYECNPDSRDNPMNRLMGYQTLDNGLTFLGCSAGGDWEHPVFFIVYWDGKKLRGYVPTDGNPWNRTTKQAYGNDEDDDLKDAKKQWPDRYKDEDDEKYFDTSDVDFDAELIEKDIRQRILPIGTEVKNVVATPIAKKQEIDVPLPVTASYNPSASLQERVKALKFYGTGDEAYELFQQLSESCYKLVGLGQDEKAEVVYAWLLEMAINSKTWAAQQLKVQSIEDLDQRCREEGVDIVQGGWGDLF